MFPRLGDVSLDLLQINHLKCLGPFSSPGHTSRKRVRLSFEAQLLYQVVHLACRRIMSRVVANYAMKMTQVGSFSIIWTSSTSNTDFDVCYLTIHGARIGHLHLHTNLKTGRIQAWILETRCWEEHAVNLNRTTGSSIENMVRDPHWLDLVCCARSNTVAGNA